jgi:XXXCH domain-containing protein
MAAAKKSSISLEKIAGELSELAEDLSRNKIRVGSSLVDIDPPTFFKTKQKIKDGRVYFTLSFQAPIANTDDISDGTTQKEVNKTASAGTAAKPRPETGKHPEGKKLKKQITRQWKNIIKNFNENIAPTKAEAKKLLAACEDYNLYADRQWSKDWQSCCQIVQNTIDAALAGNFPKAQQLATEVNRLTKVCHKKYK